MAGWLSSSPSRREEWATREQHFPQESNPAHRETMFVFIKGGVSHTGQSLWEEVVEGFDSTGFRFDSCSLSKDISCCMIKWFNPVIFFQSIQAHCRTQNEVCLCHFKGMETIKLSKGVRVDYVILLVVHKHHNVGCGKLVWSPLRTPLFNTRWGDDGLVVLTVIDDVSKRRWQLLCVSVQVIFAVACRSKDQ